ncbi:MAG: dihydrofolate reductase family protein [Solirubrobacterales bacterium]|nr:dihydrofolate reductase family protein [Solirubrobacterales bacterium]
MEFNQLLPRSATVDVLDLLATLDGAAAAPPERPYMLGNFVVSADGRATIAGRSGTLSDDGDRAMFHGLREQVDAVMAGTGTIRTERYGRIIRSAERRERRVQRGLAAEPLACIVSRSGDLPLDAPLFSAPEAKVVVFSQNEIDVKGCAAQIEVVMLDPGEMTLTTSMRRLRSDFGIRLLLCEGGPTLFGALLREALVDELFLTIAPKLAGGGRAPTLASGPELTEPQLLELKWLLERSGSLYHRYLIG